MIRGYLFILAAACLWGLLGPIAKYAFQEGVSPLEVAFWRAVLAWVFFATHAAATRRVRLHRKDIPMMALFAATGVTCFFGFYQLAVQGGGAALAAVLLYTAPAWVLVMSRMFLKEALTPLKLVALCLTLTGVATISLGGSGDITGVKTLTFSLSAIVFGLASGFCYALYYIFGKFFSDRYTSPNLFLYILPFGALGLLPWVNFTQKTPMAWSALIALAFLCTYASYYFYYIGLKHLEPTRAAITATMEPVMAGIVAFFWWNEMFSFAGYVGSGLILLAVMTVVWDGARALRSE